MDQSTVLSLCFVLSINLSIYLSIYNLKTLDLRKILGQQVKNEGQQVKNMSNLTKSCRKHYFKKF